VVLIFDTSNTENNEPRVESSFAEERKQLIGYHANAVEFLIKFRTKVKTMHFHIEHFRVIIK